MNRILARLAILTTALVCTTPLHAAVDQDGGAMALVPSIALDTDADGVADAADNCRQVANPVQIDRDGDGFGNRCDPDFDNDHAVDLLDLEYMKSVFGSGDALADLNADGKVDFQDLAILKAYFGGTPGAAPLRRMDTVLGGDVTIFTDPATTTVRIGEVVTLQIIGDFTADPTIGGGLDVDWDPASLSLTSWIPFDWGNDPGLFGPGTVDAANGSISSFGAGNFSGVGSIVTMAEITVEGVAPGIASLTMSDDSDGAAGPFVSAVTFQVQDVVFIDPQIDVLPAAPAPFIAIAPPSVDFGTQEAGTTQASLITIRNLGAEDLIVGAIGALDPVAAPFALPVDGCSNTVIVSSANCTVTVHFSPTAAGAFADGFSVPSNDPFQPNVTVDLSGTGVVLEPEISVTPSPAVFADTLVDDTATLLVTVSNQGDADLAVGNVALADPLAAPFTVAADNCSLQTVAPGGSCTLMLGFQPGEDGNFTDSFDIPSDDPAQPVVTVSVEGEGKSVFMGSPNLFNVAAQCLNRTTSQSVPVTLNGQTFWDCQFQGLDVSPGNRLRLSVAGVANGAESITGTVGGMNVRVVLCRNLTTAQSVLIQPTGTSWNCTLQGFLADPGDEVRMFVLGLATAN